MINNYYCIHDHHDQSFNWLLKIFLQAKKYSYTKIEMMILDVGKDKTEREREREIQCLGWDLRQSSY